MKSFIKSVVAGLALVFAAQGYAAGTVEVIDPTVSREGVEKSPFLLAKKERKGRKRIITTEARAKGSNKTKIDFDEAEIDGERRAPAGIAITKNRPDHEYDLINLRLRWHPEMIQSTANLETGRGR